MTRYWLILGGAVLGWISLLQAQPAGTPDTDEAVLKSRGIATGDESLLDFFRLKSMKEGDEKHLPALARQLGSDVFPIREKAFRELVARGPVALPFLTSALTNSPLEVKRRAELCIKKIEEDMQGDAITAAARLLAKRKTPKAAEVLFHFAPSVSNDPFLEEEVLACVGKLTIEPGKVDPLILNALKESFPWRRANAAYLIGRRAGPEFRAQLRELLNDTDPIVQQRARQGFYGKRAGQMLEESRTADETLLKSQKVELTEAALIDYFKQRTLSEKDQLHYRALVKKLGSNSWLIRDQATVDLLKVGTPILPFLKEVQVSDNLEQKRRAENALEKIRSTSNTAIPIAAAHLLAVPAQKAGASPGEAIRALLAYIPFADDDQVEEEILTCLTLLCLRETKLEPELIKALDDTSTIRRAAACYVLGHVGTKDLAAKLPDKLNDLQPLVRLRASQGLLATGNKIALTGFVNLIEKLPEIYLPRVEEILYRVADDKGPNEPILANSNDARAKAAKAWAKWLEDNQSRIDLGNFNERESHMGLITIAEYDNQVGNINGQVWEGPRGGQKRWNFAGVLGAMDAQSLPNGRVLVAENSANRVTERDTKGDIKWTYTTPNNPICVQRLPNGNTFIASYNMVMEIKPDRTELYRLTPGPQFYIFSAHKARNGHIVAITAQGQVIEMDSSGKQINTVQTQTQGNWCSVELQTNGNYLVACLSTGMVRELDRKGTEVWSKQWPGVFRATRLPNGNVLLGNMNTREVVEMDRSGTIRWSIRCQGRPWGIHYR